jgi:chaperonin GroES
MQSTSTDIVCLGERVIISLDKVPETTASGLIVTALEPEKPASGVIVGIGNLVDPSEWPVSAGDRVYFAKYAGAEVKIENETYYVVSVSDLLAKVV